jgi:hypothetical protein
MGSRLRRRSTVCLLATLLLSGVATAAGCGASNEKENLMEGEPVVLGELQWNVLFSRFLNPQDTEDRQYLVGQRPPPAKAAYLGVFVQVLNKDKENRQSLPPALTVMDTERQVFDSLPSKSEYALHLGTDVDPEDQLPALDSAGQVGPVKGSLVLFLIPDTASENRPLELVIPGQDGPATVDLDL